MTDTVILDDHPKLIKFLKSQKALTMANVIDKEGTVHASAMLYYCTINPLRFYIITDKSTEKCNLLNEFNFIKCAIVVGSEKGTPFSVQMRGEFKQINPLENKEIIDEYYKKLNNKYDDINDPKNILLEYTPNWAKVSDYTKGYTKYYLDLTQ